MTEWFERLIPESVDLRGSGIYVWEIEGVGVYVGKARRLSQRLRAYPRSVANILAGRPYRKHKPDGFREVHRALAAACAEGRRVTVRVAEVCAEADLNEREAYWIGQLGTLNRTGQRAAGKPVAAGGGALTPADLSAGPDTPRAP